VLDRDVDLAPAVGQAGIANDEIHYRSCVRWDASIVAASTRLRREKLRRGNRCCNARFTQENLPKIILLKARIHG
jgi:hypothetical protein